MASVATGLLAGSLSLAVESSDPKATAESGAPASPVAQATPRVDTKKDTTPPAANTEASPPAANTDQTPAPAPGDDAGSGPALHWVWGAVTGNRRLGITIDPTSVKPVPEQLAPDLPVGAQECMWLRGEYLLWWFKKDQVPVLLTTGPAVAGGGTLGMMGTSTLFDQGTERSSGHSGARLGLGFWLNDCHSCALETSGFFLGRRSESFVADSTQFPVLTRPFFNLNRGTEDVEIAAFPGAIAGSVTIDQSSELWGAELNLRKQLCCGCDYHLDWLAGGRYLGLDESLMITERLVGLPGAAAIAGNRITVTDRFFTHNVFWGGQIGLDAELRRDHWSLGIVGKVALGESEQTVDRSGSQLVTTPAGGATPFVGGLLAVPSNIGHFRRDCLAFVPEVGVTAGYQLTDHIRATAGYTFLYWSNVARPGEQIDRVLDVSQVPNFRTTAAPVGQTRPGSAVGTTSFWAQGVNLGLEFRF